MPGQLFTHYFLTDGIKSTPEWRTYVDQSETFAKFRTDIRHLYDSFSGYEEPNEAVTEQNLIRPILELLGWVDYLPQQGASRNEDIPDHLLFADRESVMRAAAKKKPHDRFRDALAVEESKRFGRALDARDQHGQTKAGTPHGQILRYLSTAEIVSDNRIRWGILTNGGVWRLYDYRARPRASGYFEAELAEMLKPDNEERLRLFHLLFRRGSFTLKEGATSSFLELALAEGKRYEEQVAQDLSGIVFESAFPKLCGSSGRCNGGKPAPGSPVCANLPLSTALRALCRGPEPPAGQRFALRRLRPAQARPGRHCAPDGRRRRLLVRCLQLLRPPCQPLQDHRQGRSVHRPAALQWGPICV